MVILLKSYPYDILALVESSVSLSEFSWTLEIYFVSILDRFLRREKKLYFIYHT